MRTHVTAHDWLNHSASSIHRPGVLADICQWLFSPPPYVVHADLRSETVVIRNPSSWQRVNLGGYKLGDWMWRHVFVFPSDCTVPARKCITCEFFVSRLFHSLDEELASRGAREAGNPLLVLRNVCRGWQANRRLDGDFYVYAIMPFESCEFCHGL